MIFKLSSYCFLLIILVDPLASHSDGFTRIKRADVDLQTCIDNFNVHRDKIIRTQDSQSMGAKYLNEIDLGTRGECLRLCCETENCDVFVFEEKNSGSCYLFHCGPPEDFKCKFTHHVNYSSAVLAINRHLPDLENQIKLTKHEQDLTKLRKPEIESEAIPPVPESHTIPLTTSTTTPKSKEVLPAEMKTKPPGEARKCSRYQFECKSTSECIAIYNACDGIPQCADGSDEGQELGCPESFTTAPPPPTHFNNNPAPQPPRYDPNMISPPRIHPLPPQDIYRPPVVLQDTLGVPQLQNLPHQEPDFIRPNSRNSPASVFENPQIPQYGNPAVQGNWMPHQSNQMPMQIPQYAAKNSHIFTHKENGLQVPDGQEISPIQYDSRDQYNNQKLNYYDNYNRPPMSPENWPSNQAQEEQFNNRYPPEQINNNKDWHQNSGQTAAKEPTPYIKSAPAADGHPFIEPVKENPKHEQDKMAHELKHSKDNMVHDPAPEQSQIKIEKHNNVHHEHYPDVVAYKIDGASDLVDGAAQTPGGAVLSLTLGLIITCIMALLIGCRLRVRRRMRKGGKNYAHDADYLVNGMYL